MHQRRLQARQPPRTYVRRLAHTRLVRDTCGLSMSTIVGGRVMVRRWDVLVPAHKVCCPLQLSQPRLAVRHITGTADSTRKPLAHAGLSGHGVVE
jgi:hypothetical protein